MSQWSWPIFYPIRNFWEFLLLLVFLFLINAKIVFCEVRVTLTLNHQNLTNPMSSFSPSGHLCKIGRNSLKSLLRCRHQKNGTDVDGDIMPSVTAVTSTEAEKETEDAPQLLLSLLFYCQDKKTKMTKWVVSHILCETLCCSSVLFAESPG